MRSSLILAAIVSSGIFTACRLVADEPGDLKKLSLDELMNVEITSISGLPEPLAESASAIQVISSEAIQRSTASSLPDALRLAPNLQVAQLNSSASVISARGFNAGFSNKLLVLIDGRSVYTPLDGGVLWDAQNVMLEDVDRIEVISGPGGTLWGANAVNGVINIVSKSAKETQGVYASIGDGSDLRNVAELRYGGQAGANLYYRVYLQHFDRDSTLLPNGTDAADSWNLTEGGFRADDFISETNTLTLQGDFYNGTEFTTPSSHIDGQNVLGRWTHTFSPDSELKIQVYFDRTWRDDIPTTIMDDLETFDFDLQHHFSLNPRNTIAWGFGYRLMQDRAQTSTDFVGLLPNHRKLELYSAFAEDEITLIPDTLRATIGTKLEHNIYSGFEVQPSARLAWIPMKGQTIWAAVSRAVRSPSRLDVDYYLPTFPVPATVPHVAGGPDFDSEKLTAYELGYRTQPAPSVSFSLATFYNHYDELYSVEALPGTQIYEIQNGTVGESWGAELSGTYDATRWWRLRGGYTYFHKNLWERTGHVYDNSALGDDPENEFQLQSTFDLPAHFQFDVTARYVSALPDPSVPAYFTFDVRLSWQWKRVEYSLVGQNLADPTHLEFGSQEVRRSFFAKVAYRW